MGHWGDQHAGNGDEDHATEERIAAGKHFAGRGAGRIDLPHARQDHCGIEEGIQPS
jgi:hypothetical protein